MERKIKMKYKIVFLSFVTICLLFSVDGFSQSQKTDNKKIKSLIKKKREYNRRYGFGYKIQLFYGNEKKARYNLSRFNGLFPNTQSRLKQKTPFWEVVVGNYKTKLDAERALISGIKDRFPGAIIIALTNR